MDAERTMLFQSCYANETPKIDFLNSPMCGIVESVLTQEHKGSPMQHPIQFAQIGQQITEIILASPDPQTLLASIARALGEIFQVDACSIAVLVNRSATEDVAVWYADDRPVHKNGDRAQLPTHPVLADELTHTEPLAIDDLQASDMGLAAGGCWQALSARAVLGIHTRFQSSVNGAIALVRQEPHQWTAQEKELLAVAADAVAVAISQIQMRRQVDAGARYQTLLGQLSQGICSALELDEILQMAIAGTGRALQVHRGLVLLLKYADPPFNRRPSKHLSKIEVRVAHEWLEESVSQSPEAGGQASRLSDYSFKLSESAMCQQAFRNAPELTIVTDGQDAPNPGLPCDREMMPATLIVPLVSTPSNARSNTVLGFLVLQHDRPHSWHTDELELVKWVGAQVSSTLIQNQTLRRVQSLVEERTAQLQKSLEVQAKLYEKTRQQIDQLQQLNQLKEEFMSSMSHELRTPLTTMSLAIRMLRQPQLPVERREKYLEILEEQCNKEIDLINDLLSLQRLEADRSQIQPQTIDLMLLIEELAQSFKQKWADKGLTLKVESPGRSRTPKENPKGSVKRSYSKERASTTSPELEQSLMLSTDPDSLNRILLELLTNAGKYSDPDTTVCLKVAPQVNNSGNQVVLTLSNMGPGISPSDLAHIFEKFHRGRGVTEKAVQGTGLGLALVKCLVDHLNGTIEVSSCPVENSQTALTSFTLTLPQFQQQP